MLKPSLALTSLAFLVAAPATGAAADLYEGYEVQGTVVDEDGPVVVERERVIERRYYTAAPDYDEDEPIIAAYERRYSPPYHPDRHYWRVGD